MSKSTMTYWNPLHPRNDTHWHPIEDMEAYAEELTSAMDECTGDYTRLTRFKPGADTTLFRAKSHDYPEEIMVMEGRLFIYGYPTVLSVNSLLTDTHKVYFVRWILVAQSLNGMFYKSHNQNLN